MKRVLVLLVALQSVVCSPRPRVLEPVVGTWHLRQQEINGQKSSVEALALQISQTGDRLTFAFSVPMPDIYVVTARYTVRLDGSSADITDGSGQKVGTVQMARAGGAYTVTMTGPNRPDAQGKLTLADDNKTLISESDAAASGQSIHSKQIFARD